MAKREHAPDGGSAGANGASEHRPKKKSKTDKAAKEASKTKKSTSSESKQQTTTTTTSTATTTTLSQAGIEKFFTDNEIKVSDSSSDPTPVCPIVSFADLPPCNTDDSSDKQNELYSPLREFKSPTAIQSATWPLLFAGRDVIGIAETGSGKTLAFGLPCLRRLLLSSSSSKRSDKNSKSSSSSSSPPRPSAVMISPTRELAMQIYDQLVHFAKSTPLEVACVFGGVNKDDQRRALRTASIVVATPGRLKDLVGDGSVDLSKVKYLVLDEADRMLDKGFEQDIKDIIQTMPDKKRQTVMFTATWPPSVRELASTFMTSPVTVTIGGDPSADPRANTRIKQVVEVVNPRDKENRLLQLLNQYQKGKAASDKILVFCLYKKEATRVEKMIRSRGFSVAGIHGDLSQQERFKSLDAFKSGAATILVATDVAARGLDIPAVKLVINVTFPLTVEDYVHRIGR